MKNYIFIIILKQKFCMIKDKMQFYDDYFDDTGLRCQVCSSKNHLFKYCPVLHYIPDKEFIIKQYVYP